MTICRAGYLSQMRAIVSTPSHPGGIRTSTKAQGVGLPVAQRLLHLGPVLLALESRVDLKVDSSTFRVEVVWVLKRAASTFLEPRAGVLGWPEDFPEIVVDGGMSSDAEDSVVRRGIVGVALLQLSGFPQGSGCLAMLGLEGRVGGLFSCLGCGMGLGQFER